MGKALNHLIWAVDVFSSDVGLVERAARAIAGIVGEERPFIEPVHIIRSEHITSFGDNATQSGVGLSPKAEAKMEKVLKSLPDGLVGRPRFISQKGDSIRQSVKELISYSESVHADLVVVSSHARRGPSRVLLGSFAETLLLHSTIPVLVVNPTLGFNKRSMHVLFPTDFSDSAKEGFERVIHFAKGLGWKLTLHHEVGGLKSGLELASFTTAMTRKILKKAKEDAARLADNWASYAAAEGVECQSIVTMGGQDVSESVLQVASKKRVGLIAMTNQAGAIATALVGSVTRKTVREANVPVLVLHAKKESGEKWIPAAYEERSLNLSAT